jgi:hypothetical protein
MASSVMQCNKNKLSGAEQTVLNNFVSAGGKMIIYDPECRVGVDYNWLPYNFHTSNPGATGARSGTLTIVEENELSTIAAGPKQINTAIITVDTDAVGDMNVANTTNIDSHWCLDMTGKNVQNKFGATHMYARYGSGLYIYNGMDTNYIHVSVDATGGGQLAKIWLQELQTSGSNLPCGVGVGGIALTPASATNPVNTSHTVTALVTIAGTGTPIQNVTVTFVVTSGPNSGATGTNVTDAAGKASWTYPDNGGAGTDKIKASFVDNTGATISSSEVEKIWGGGVGGIALTPVSATNPVNTSHTVTALVTMVGTGTPIQNVTVTFVVTSGPNSGATGTNVTDAAGKASWTYPDNGGAGTDKIKASFVDQDGKTISSNEVEKLWNGGGTSVPEFPSLVVPVAGIMGIVLLLFRRREN